MNTKNIKIIFLILYSNRIAINGLEQSAYLCREKKDEYIKVDKPKKEKAKKVVQKKAQKSVKVVALTNS